MCKYMIHGGGFIDSYDIKKKTWIRCVQNAEASHMKTKIIVNNYIQLVDKVSHRRIAVQA